MLGVVFLPGWSSWNILKTARMTTLRGKNQAENPSLLEGFQPTKPTGKKKVFFFSGSTTQKNPAYGVGDWYSPLKLWFENLLNNLLVVNCLGKIWLRKTKKTSVQRKILKKNQSSNPENDGIVKQVVWRSQKPAIQGQTPSIGGFNRWFWPGTQKLSLQLRFFSEALWKGSGSSVIDLSFFLVISLQSLPVIHWPVVWQFPQVFFFLEVESWLRI